MEPTGLEPAFSECESDGLPDDLRPRLLNGNISPKLIANQIIYGPSHSSRESPRRGLYKAFKIINYVHPAGTGIQKALPRTDKVTQILLRQDFFCTFLHSDVGERKGYWHLRLRFRPDGFFDKADFIIRKSVL